MLRSNRDVMRRSILFFSLAEVSISVCLSVVVRPLNQGHPFVLLSNENLLDHVSVSIIDRLKVTPLGKFKYDPRKSNKEKWVALIQRADNNRQAH